MALELRLNQKLDLQLKLAPQIIQSIEILQLPSVDLQALIEQELDTNEYLERRIGEEAPEDGPPPEPTDAPEDGREYELERLERMGAFDEEMPRFKSSLNQEASDRKQEAMNNTPGAGQSLHDLLLEQFHLLEIEPRFRALGETMIGFVNDSGRFEGDFADILKEHPEHDLDDAEYVLARIQGLEPRGIAARDIRECLLLQLDHRDPRFELKRRLIEDYLEDLARNRRPKITKALGIDFDELDELVAEIAQLDDQPGKSAVEETPHYIYPDIVVDWTPNGYEVRLAQDAPGLEVNQVYRDVLADDRLSEEYKGEVRKQVENARWLISAIEQRQQTLRRVATRIVHYQRDFLEFGPHYLRPLKMQEIADDLGIHVSTVSRATSEKYMQTHRGIFSLKYFFTGATTSTDGGVESRSSVRQRVKEIIDAEDKRRPLSDEAIVKKLKDNFGVEVARRTITKYRKSLGVPSTRQRRTF
ncbi:MAG: RNA polymerase factor sigma-54 [Planctomycetota bacterium]